MTITLAGLIFYFIGMTQLFDLSLTKREDFERGDNITVIIVSALCFSVSVALLSISNIM